MMLICSCSTLGESGSPSFPARGWSSEMQIQWVYCLKLCVLQTFWLGFLLLRWKFCCWEIFCFFCCWFPLPLLSLPRNSLDTRVLPGALKGRGCWFDFDFFFLIKSCFILPASTESGLLCVSVFEKSGLWVQSTPGCGRLKDYYLILLIYLFLNFYWSIVGLQCVLISGV